MCESRQLLVLWGPIPGLFTPGTGCGGPEKERLAAETGGVGDSKVGPTVHREHHTQVQADAPETGKASSRVDGCGPLLAARGRFLPTEGAAGETASRPAGRGTQAACLLFLQMMEIRT